MNTLASHRSELSNALNWEQLYTRYQSERQPSAQTVARQTAVLTKFFKFLGHDNPSAVTREDVLRWRDERLTQVSPSTVQKTDIAHLHAVFTWAQKCKELASNPVADVHIELPGRTVSRVRNPKRAYTLHEANMILTASLKAPAKSISAETAAARRWIPWVAAYTGARITEIAQLKSVDVYRSSIDKVQLDIWSIKLGSGASRRFVPVHPHLVEQGFIDFVARQSEYLFLDPKRRSEGTDAKAHAGAIAKRLARWVRKDLQIIDPSVLPNKAWGPLFVNRLLQEGVHKSVIDALTGTFQSPISKFSYRVNDEQLFSAISAIPKFAPDG